MSNKEYPLHPGQTQTSPNYVQVPQSEYESLKRENKQLHALLHGANCQDSNAEIDTLASECRALREMNAKAQEEIAALKDAQRWRNAAEETPTDETEVPVILNNGWKTTDYFEKDKDRWHYHWNTVAYWFQIPKAPEAE